jgi:hypothetical protein
MRFLPTLSWWAKRSPDFPSRLHKTMYLPFDFRLEKTPGGTPATGHYLRTVTLEIRTDDLRQIAQSEDVTTMANRVRHEEHAVRTALGCGTRDVIPGGKK